MPVDLTTGTGPSIGAEKRGRREKMRPERKDCQGMPGGAAGAKMRCLRAKRSGKEGGQEAPVKCAATGSCFLLKV